MPDASNGSITRWIADLKAGDLAAAQPLWERYFARMVELARARLSASCRRDAGSDEEDEDDILARAVGSEPTPEFAAMVAEEYRRLLDRLGDDVLRKVAILRMEGVTNDAIAEQLGCSRRTVARQLVLIRRILTAEP